MHRTILMRIMRKAFTQVSAILCATDSSINPLKDLPSSLHLLKFSVWFLPISLTVKPETCENCLQLQFLLNLKTFFFNLFCQSMWGCWSFCSCWSESLSDFNVLLWSRMKSNFNSLFMRRKKISPLL